MDDARRVWVVERGAVDVFVRERADDVEISPLQHVLHACKGRMLFGVAPLRDNNRAFGLVAKGLPGTRLRALDMDDLAALDPVQLAAQADVWLAGLAAMLTRDVERRPKPDLLLDAGQTVQARGVVGVRRGVIWAAGLPPADTSFMGLVDPAGSTDLMPLTASTWVVLTADSDLKAVSSQCLAREGSLLPALRDFHDAAFSLEMLNRGIALADLANLDRMKRDSRDAEGRDARKRLFNLYGRHEASGDDDGPDGLFTALRHIGAVQEIRFTFPVLTEETRSTNPVKDIADLTGVRVRQVNLVRQERWWIGADSPMLAYRVGDGRPVALLPRLSGGYRAVDPITGQGNRLNKLLTNVHFSESRVWNVPVFWRLACHTPEKTAPHPIS